MYVSQSLLYWSTERHSKKIGSNMTRDAIKIVLCQALFFFFFFFQSPGEHRELCFDLVLDRYIVAYFQHCAAATTSWLLGSPSYLLCCCAILASAIHDTFAKGTALHRRGIAWGQADPPFFGHHDVQPGGARVSRSHQPCEVWPHQKGQEEFLFALACFVCNRGARFLFLVFSFQVLQVVVFLFFF